MITLNPNSPSTDDNVELVFSTGGCPTSITQNTTGSEYHLVIGPNGPCDFLLPAFQHSWNIGRIPAGSYSATFTQSTSGPGIISLNETVNFTVSKGVLPFPSSIPILTAPALSLLIVSLVFVAYRRFTRRH